MSNPHSAQAEFVCWKQHSCVGCGGVFRYLMRRVLGGRGASRASAARAAARAASRAKRSQVDLQPCPQCGLYQPDMVGFRRARWHGWIWIAAMVALVWGLPVGLLAARLAPRDRGPMAAAGAVSALWVAGLAGDVWAHGGSGGVRHLLSRGIRAGDQSARPESAVHRLGGLHQQCR